MKSCRSMCTEKSLRLYAVTDRHWLGNRSLRTDVEASLRGGATFVQLREKDLDYDAFLVEASDIKELCREYGVPFVVNDNVRLAVECDADGVHVGQSDMSASDVRKIIGEDKILGVSAGTVEEAVSAERSGADYLGVGAVFPTGSKDDAFDVSLETLRDICESVQIPVIAIGGITGDNVSELAGSGVCGVAVISAIYAKEDIQGAASDLLRRVEAALDI